MNWKAAAAAVGLLTLAAGSAHATATFTYYAYGAGAPTLSLLDNFSGDTVGSAPAGSAAYSWSPAGSGMILNTTSALGAQPATSATTFDTGKYLSVLGAKPVTLTLVKPVSEIEIYIGSLDTYNTISFSDGSSFGGLVLNPTIAADSGSTTAANTNGMFDFKFTAPITSVTFASTINSFEIASISTPSGVPEPATWAMMLMGLFGLGGAMRFARRNRAASATA